MREIKVLRGNEVETESKGYAAPTHKYTAFHLNNEAVNG